ncbi:unnamed protein product, partial [Mesorhabditis belari]|uniref:Uncharacterized protein n=1 Tax=Mesorhabditis belari TaxID=2138241 RepID=A0AAF3FDK6_9BILA
MPIRDRPRTILITGATDGVGKQTAADLAQHPDNFVIIHGRTKENCEKTIDQIRREGARYDNIDYIAIDFTSLDSVATGANQLSSRYPSLNCVVCNAAVLQQRRHDTIDGYEHTFQVNFLAHFVLLNRLLPTLEQNSPGRIIVIGSTLHSWTSIEWTDLQAEQEYEKYLQFSRSKLMCHLMAFALHRRMALTGFKVTVNVMDLGREKRETNNNYKFRCASALSTSESVFSVGRSAGGLVQMIESPALDTLSGKYLDCHGKQMRSGSEATDERLQERLWSEAAKLARDHLIKS